MITKIVNVEDSLGVAIPKAYLEALDLDLNSEIEINMVNETIVINPKRKVRQGWAEAFAKQALDSNDEDPWMHYKNLPDEIEDWNWE